jgi:hypothetical protein
VIAIAGSFVSLHLHPTPQDWFPQPGGVKGLRDHPHASRRAIYARSCKWTSENSPSRHFGE